MSTPKVLAGGQLAASKGTLYTCPARTFVSVAFFNIFNTTGGSETIKLYVKKSGGSSRQIVENALASKATYQVINGNNIMLSPGDTLEGSSTNATSSDYVISGEVTH